MNCWREQTSPLEKGAASQARGCVSSRKVEGMRSCEELKFK